MSSSSPFLGGSDARGVTLLPPTPRGISMWGLALTSVPTGKWGPHLHENAATNHPR